MQGNPEFKLFIQQLGEASCGEDLKQNPSILSFRSARYSVTLTDQTHAYLLREQEQTHLTTLKTKTKKTKTKKTKTKITMLNLIFKVLMHVPVLQLPGDYTL